MIQHACGKRAESMYWPYHGEDPDIKTTKLGDDAPATTAAELLATKRERKAISDTWMCWMYEASMNNESVVAAALCVYQESWRVFCRYLYPGQIEALNHELCLFCVDLRHSVGRVSVVIVDKIPIAVVFSHCNVTS